MSSFASNTWIYVLLFLTFIGSNEAMIDKFKHLSVGYEVRSLHQFKFGKGGSLALSGHMFDIKQDIIEDQTEIDTNADKAEEELFSLNLYHCTEKEIETLNKYDSMRKLCADIDSFECAYHYTLNNDNKFEEIAYSFHSLHTQWMTMVIISCEKDQTYSIANLNLVSNSKVGEYLSLNQVNYKVIYMYFSCVFASIFLVYFLHLFRYFFIPYLNVKMQLLLLIYPLLQCISCIFNHLFWNYSSEYGILNNDYLLFCYILDALCNGLLALICVFICYGFKWIHNYPFTSLKLKCEIFLIILFITVSSILQNYFSFMILTCVISYVWCFRLMLKSYTDNIRLLQSQMEILNNETMANDTRESPVQIKLKMLKLFQKGIILFIGIKISFYWISSILLYEMPYLNDVIINLFTILFVIFLFYNFRMSRPFKPYFYLIDQNMSEFNHSFSEGLKLNKNEESVNYNLHFKSEMLIIENIIDYFTATNDANEDSDEEDGIITNYTLSTPFTIDINVKKDNGRQKYGDDNNGNGNNFDEQTPLLLKTDS